MEQSSQVVRSTEWSIGSRDIFFTELNSGSVIKRGLHRAQLVTGNALDFTSMQVRIRSRLRRLHTYIHYIHAAHRELIRCFSCQGGAACRGICNSPTLPSRQPGGCSAACQGSDAFEEIRGGSYAFERTTRDHTLTERILRGAYAFERSTRHHPPTRVARQPVGCAAEGQGQMLSNGRMRAAMRKKPIGRPHARPPINPPVHRPFRHTVIHLPVQPTTIPPQIPSLHQTTYSPLLTDSRSIFCALRPRPFERELVSNGE